MTEKNLTCIVCPLGCSIKVTLDGEKIVNVEGNSCPRGKEYAVSECTNPMRTLTTTIKCDNGRVLPVKTKKPIPKGKLKEYMDFVNNLLVHLDE